MKLLLILLYGVAAMFAGGCNQKPMRYLALGDSYTIGESVAGRDRWPAQLVDGLKGSGLEFEDVRYIARTGWTTDELAQAIKSEHLEPPYDLVSLLIGVNNQYRGRPLEEYREQFRGLLATAIEMAGGKPSRVFVVSIPDWGQTPFASGQERVKIGKEIDEFNAAAHAICTASGVAFVDITPESRRLKDDVAPDGLHPSGEQYKAWAEKAQPVVRGLF